MLARFLVFAPLLQLLLLLLLQCDLYNASQMRTSIHVAATSRAAQSPGQIIVRRLIDLKERAAADIRQGADAWAESQGRCGETTSILQREADVAHDRLTDMKAKLAQTRMDFNNTEVRVQNQREHIDVLSEEIHRAVKKELPKAEGYFKTASEKLNAAIAAAAPENSRLTIAIQKVNHIIASIKYASGVGLESNDNSSLIEPNAATELTDSKPVASDAPNKLLLVDLKESADQEPDDSANEVIPDVGPRFSAALVKLHELKHGIEKLRNNSLAVFEIRRQKAEDQMHYQTEQIKRISSRLNETRRELAHSSEDIVSLESHLQNLTRNALKFEIQIPQIKDDVRRSEEALVEMRKFCESSHNDYEDGKTRAEGVAGISDELTELVTARLAKIQEALSEARLVTLDSAVARAERETPASYKRLYENNKVTEAGEEALPNETFATTKDDSQRVAKGPIITGAVSK